MRFTVHANAVRILCAALVAPAAIGASATFVAAQQAPATLTLQEAVDLARRNNPTFRATANDASEADWAVREAYGSFLPSLNVGNTFSYQVEGTPQAFGVFTAEDLGLGVTPASYSSSYGINANISISGNTFFQAARAKASRKATDARIDAAEYTLASDVTRQYLAALRARDQVTLAKSVLERAEEAERLASARAQAGEATKLDLTQAEVERGRGEVGIVQAENTYETEKLRLLQMLGVELNRDIELTSDFQIFEPTWSEEELVGIAMRSHPQLVAARAAEDAGNAASRAAKTSYLPTLSLNGRWSGFVRKSGDDAYILGQARSSAQGRISNCEFLNALTTGLSSPLPDRPAPVDCSKFALTSAQEQAVLANNSNYPFDYSTNPATFSLTVSLPILDGFTRERQLQTARVAAEDAKFQRRAEELNRKAQVVTSLMAVRTAYRTVGIESRNQAAATEALNLAQERYRLGAGSILELAQAQENNARADQAYLQALYTFHENLALLESAVGTPLRQ